MPILRFPSFSGTMPPAPYALTAPLLLLTPHLVVGLLMAARGTPLIADVGFWLLPLRRLAMSPSLSIGVQKGPPIGVQKGPRLSSGVTGMAGVPFALVAA